MDLKVGDKIYCKVKIDTLTFGNSYEVIHTRPKSRWNENDICIKDNEGCNWWFGQIGSTEPWTDWFMSEREWRRFSNLTALGL